MNDDRRLELIAIARESGVALLSPGVGWFTRARVAGEVLTPGSSAGCLITLGRARELVVPAGVAGVVTSLAPERVHEPVGFKRVLYELAPLARSDAVAGDSRDDGAADGAALAFRSPSSGRFWHRPSPNELPLIALGSLLSGGSPVGLIEVMKTFTQVLYRAERGLPERARVVRLLAQDGDEVDDGQPLFEVEAE